MGPLIFGTPHIQLGAPARFSRCAGSRAPAPGARGSQGRAEDEHTPPLQKCLHFITDPFGSIQKAGSSLLDSNTLVV